MIKLDVPHLDQRDVQCVLNAETNDGPTMRYSPISKGGMLSSPTNLEDPPQPPTAAATGLDPGPDICGTPRSEERQIETKLDIPQLVRQLVFTCVRECGHSGSTRVGRQS